MSRRRTIDRRRTQHISVLERLGDDGTWMSTLDPNSTMDTIAATRTKDENSNHSNKNNNNSNDIFTNDDDSDDDSNVIVSPSKQQQQRRKTVVARQSPRRIRRDGGGGSKNIKQEMNSDGDEEEEDSVLHLPSNQKKRRNLPRKSRATKQAIGSTNTTIVLVQQDEDGGRSRRSSSASRNRTLLSKEKTKISSTTKRKTPSTKVRSTSLKTKKKTNSTIATRIMDAQSQNQDEKSFDSADDQISSHEEDNLEDEDFVEENEEDEDEYDDDEDEDDDHASSESDLEVNRSSRRSRYRKKVPQPKQQQHLRKSTQSRSTRKPRGSDSDSDSGIQQRCYKDDTSGTLVHGTPNKRTMTTKVTSLELSSHRPIRSAAIRASQRLSLSASKSTLNINDDNDDDDDDDDDDDRIVTSKKKRKMKRIFSDDEEFILDDDNDDNEDEELDKIGKDFQFHDETNTDSEEAENNIKIGVVKDNEIGIVNDDSSVEFINAAYFSPQLNVTNRQSTSHKATLDDNASSEDDTEEMQSPTKPCCFSTHDAITEEPLPECHICFWKPDGLSRACFALETLRKIAVTTSNPQFVNGRKTYLQPPHFRTKISDELLDQIASRFGRDATDPCSDYFQRQPMHTKKTWLEPTEVEQKRFEEQVEEYMSETMKNQDVYVCPLCYIMSHKQLHGDKKRNHQEQYSTDFLYDPMTILGFLDNDNYRIASAFCFKKVSVLKQHLRNDHEVDTKVVHGNDVYERYKIRKPDGLLQRYLKKTAGDKWTTKQGDMMRYWLSGSNSYFLLLLSHIPQAASCREVLESGDSQSDLEHVLEAQEFLEPAINFFNSFISKASDIWDVVAAPFLKETEEEIEDIVDENYEEDDEDDDRGKHQELMMKNAMEAFRQSQNEDERRAERYERMEKDAVYSADESGKEDSNVYSEEEVDDDVKNGGYFDDDTTDDDDDDFAKNIERKRLAKLSSQSLSPKKRSGRRVSLSELKTVTKQNRGNLKDSSPPQSEDEFDVPATPALSAQKRIQDDDSD